MITQVDVPVTQTLTGGVGRPTTMQNLRNSVQFFAELKDVLGGKAGQQFIAESAISLREMAQLLFEEHDAPKKDSTETTVDEFQGLEHLPPNARLH